VKKSMLHLALGAVLAMTSALSLTACGTGATALGSSVTPTSIPASNGGGSSHVVVIPNNDIFAPYIMDMAAGDSVTWVNEDTVLHTIVTTPQALGGTLNPIPIQLVIAPGKAASMTLNQPGLYYYVCDAHASAQDTGPAVAHTGVRPYPLPMDGFLYVRGPGVSGAPNPEVIMSSDDRFTPWITIVNPGATITWKNQTSQRLHLKGVPGYGHVNPTNLAFDVAAGGTESTTFQVVGIYDYYTTEQARLDSVWLRPAAISGTAGYPAPMEGIVAVFP
jgi:plastocyanin